MSKASRLFCLKQIKYCSYSTSLQSLYEYIKFDFRRYMQSGQPSRLYYFIVTYKNLILYKYRRLMKTVASALNNYRIQSKKHLHENNNDDYVD